ncbi:MAG: LamG-like jellyroll fold domain-containing protein [Candidatus Neomarinimicrobiota bacterium]
MFKYIKIILITFFATFTLGFSQDDFSLSFDGEDDYVDFGDAEVYGLTESSSMTIMFNLKIQEFPTFEFGSMILTKYENFNIENSNFYISVTQDGYIRVAGDGTDIVDIGAINQNEWNFVAIVFEGGSISKSYINDTFVGNYSLNLSSNISTMPLLLGSSDIFEEQYLNGSIDNLSFWDAPLTEEHIFALRDTLPYGNEIDLISYWDFNEGIYELVEDVAGSGNNGLIYGASWDEEVPNGCNDPLAENYDEGSTFNDGSCEYPDNGDYALSFDGEDDFVEGIASSSLNASITNEITISAWINSIELSGVQTIIAHGDGESNQYNLAIDGGYLYFLTAGANGDPGSFEDGIANVSFTSLGLNRWYHVAMTYDQESVKLYIDGNLDFQHDIVDIFPDNTGQFSLGKSTQGNAIPNYTGYIRNIQIWNVALEETEIQAYMEDSPLGDEDGLAGYWKFNSGDGDILYDHSGNQNHGTITGATWEEVIQGCSDPLAENYNIDANFNDGSCQYPDNGDYALSFDGEDDYVDVNTGSFGPTTSNDATIMMWIYPVSNGFLVGQYENGVANNANFLISIDIANFSE